MGEETGNGGGPDELVLEATLTPRILKQLKDVGAITFTWTVGKLSLNITLNYSPVEMVELKEGEEDGTPELGSEEGKEEGEEGAKPRIVYPNDRRGTNRIPGDKPRDK